MKRRQRGILTGMPFMANLADQTFVDDLGRPVYLPQAPRRIVSRAPSVTEILFAVGLDAEVVGVTTFCDYPAQAKTRPKIGAAIPNLEAILGLKPDLVVAGDNMRPDVLAKLEQLKIPVFVLFAKTLEDVLGHISTIGRMVGHEPEARRVVQRLRDRLADIRRRTASVRRVRTCYVVNTDPLISVANGSFIHHMIETAGGENVVGRARAPYPKVSVEEVLRQDPEVILFPVGAAEGIPETEQQFWRRWPNLSAVAHHRLHQIRGELINRPGPRRVDGTELMARYLHPDLFPTTGGAKA